MSRILSLLGLLALLSSAAGAWAQETAGRFLAVAGDVSVARGAQRIVALPGTEVLVGDTVNVAANSNAQLRFTDQGIVALRPDTSFRVSDYSFRTAEPTTQRAFFELLKGGLRTITGSIGQPGAPRYRMKTLHATVGIRGTGYTLIACENDCRNPDGSPVANGTYGGVTEGRIAVTNEGGEVEFGVDQYFYVANALTAPQGLMTPPSFLVAKRARATAQQVAQAAKSAAAASAAAATPAAAPAAEAAPTTAPTSAAAALPAVGFQVTSNPDPQSLLVASSFTGTSFYRVAGPFDLAVSCAAAPCANFKEGEISMGVNYALGRAGVSLAIKDANGHIFNLGTPGAAGGVPITVVGNTATFTATLNLADFPLNTGAFRCSACGPGGTPGVATQLVISGSITGGNATVTLTLVSASGSFTVTAPLQLLTPPNNLSAALSMPRQAGGVDIRSGSYWEVGVDSQGRLVRFGPSVGGPAAALTGGTTTTLGSAPSAGNLVWGQWAGAAAITDSNYANFTTGTNSRQMWIVGEVSNTLPQSLGQLTFVPVGHAFTSATQQLNSASLTADFVNRSLSLSINATNASAGNTFQMSAATSFSPTTGRFGGGFANVTCAGPCVGSGPAGGSYNGFFSGAQVSGAGVVYSAGFGAGTGVTGVIAFGRGP